MNITYEPVVGGKISKFCFLAINFNFRIIGLIFFPLLFSSWRGEAKRKFYSDFFSSNFFFKLKRFFFNTERKIIPTYPDAKTSRHKFPCKILQDFESNRN